MVNESSIYLRLTRLDVPRVQVTDLEEREELLSRRAIEAVRPSYHGWNAERCHGPACLSTAVCRGPIQDQDCVIPPVRVLSVQVDDEPVKESTEGSAVVGRLRHSEVAGTIGVDSCDH